MDITDKLAAALNEWDKHWFNCRTCSPKRFCMAGKDRREKMLDTLAEYRALKEPCPDCAPEGASR